MDAERTLENLELGWLDLPVGEAVELEVLTDPVFAPVHPFLEGWDGRSRNFGCRGSDCFWCAAGTRPVPFGYSIIRTGGMFRLFQITRSLVRKAELRSGSRVVLRKLSKNPWFEVLEHTVIREDYRGHYFRVGGVDATFEDLEEVPLRVVSRLKSLDYLLENGPTRAFDFVNRRSE